MEKLKKFLLENWKWIILFICVISFIFLVEDVMDSDIMVFDAKWYNFISLHLISDVITPVAKFITNFGSAYWLIGFSIFLLFVIKNRKIGISILLNLGISTITNYTLKQILQRPRPTEFRIIDESGYSLPSGHSMVSMAFYGYLIYLVYKNIKNKYIRISLITFLSILIVSIGISRIYLGVHYTSDVIAGFLVAIAYLIIYTNTIKNNTNNITNTLKK
ncbi:MAG: phosphatase PAP2 family protein [Clostridia bacterium]|nr:phosphatase PAP2 family protein [Clostridia bacterium]